MKSDETLKTMSAINHLKIYSGTGLTNVNIQTTVPLKKKYITQCQMYAMYLPHTQVTDSASPPALFHQIYSHRQYKYLIYVDSCIMNRFDCTLFCCVYFCAFFKSM